MPAKPNYSKRDHPIKLLTGSNRGTSRPPQAQSQPYAELRCHSNFSFLRGASHPEELAERASELGYAALAITDRNTLAGVVRMHCAAKACNLKLIVGAEITPTDAPSVTLYATDRASYGRLCRIITQGRLRTSKGACSVTLKDVAERSAGLIAAIQSPLYRCTSNSHLRTSPGYLDSIHTYRDIFGYRLYLSASVHGGADDRRHLYEADALAQATGVPLVASNDVYYHEPNRRFLQDVVTCIREHCTLPLAGRRLFANAERYLKSTQQMRRIFAEYPDALVRTVEIADRCHFSLDELRYEYPEALCPPDRSPTDYLAALTWSGARGHYPGGVPKKIRKVIEHELSLIRKLDYEPYFLTVWDIVRFARSRDILCQGRGSAANSAVCYCLGITSVDPDRIDLLFERFVSAERNEPPDIDVDFEHERREEVFQYIYNKYGREHAGIVAEVISYRPRSAIRDVGKVLGLSLDHTNMLAKKHDWWHHDALPEEFVRETGLDPADRTLRMLRKLVRELIGFPRHLSQHVGGFVMTRGPLCEMVPIENAAMQDRTFIEWDKDDIDALGILKIDCLALGMLTAIHKCFRFVDAQALANCGGHAVPLLLHNIPEEDPSVYEMICRADTVGVFQIESRAQMSMLPRLQPRSFYDLVIEVAIVRPGPIQGGMVHPYLRRRSGRERVVYPNEAIKKVLSRTLGVPLFQEQAMRLAVVAAGFTPGEADQLRRAMGAWRHRGDINRFSTKLVEGMKASGLSADFAQRCFKQICGFGEYGFPESHAASFALLVYVSSWLKRYHPAAFCASLINSQPMGFYQPAQLVRDAKEHGVTVLPIDVNHSGYDCRLTDTKSEPRTSVRPALGGRSVSASPRSRFGPGSRCQDIAMASSGHADPVAPSGDPSTWGRDGPAVRLGMRLVTGLSRAKVEAIDRAAGERAFTSVSDLFHRSNASRATLAKLAAADAMRSLGLNRREAVWQVLALGDEPPLLANQEAEEPTTRLPIESLEQTVLADYDTVGLSLTAHPISLVRAELRRLHVTTAKSLRDARQGQRLRVGGLVLVRQRPSTALGIVFCTLEDETGVANLVIRPKIYDQYRPVARSAVALVAEGRVERQGEVVHLQVTRLTDMSAGLLEMESVSRDFH